MARRKRQSLVGPETFVRLLLTVGAIWLVTRLLCNLPSGTGSVLGWVVLAAAVAAMAYPLIRLSRRAVVRGSLLRKAQVACDEHLASLTRRRAQLVQPDAYGKPQFERWEREIGYFISQHIQPLLTSHETTALGRNHNEVARFIEAHVDGAMRDEPAFQTFSDDMTPAEFETFCAEELRQAGWNARVTGQSRDQGVDVIAEKAGQRVVLQCKLYARPVGNKSVQVAAAARAHEQGDLGIVVSNNRYTLAAEQLANTNGVLLLHYRDLRNLDTLLNRAR
jgi:restriction system protein